MTEAKLRGDLLQRYEHHFGKGGFRYLLDKGVVYRNAHYQHANTETIVGHATLATGVQLRWRIPTRKRSASRQ